MQEREREGAQALRAAEDAREQAERAAEERERAEEASDRAVAAREDAAEAGAEADSARDDAVGARDDAAGAREDAVEAVAEAERARLDAVRAAEDAARKLALSIAVPDPLLDEQARRREAGVDADNPFGRPGRPMNLRSPLRVGFGAAVGVGLAYLLYRALINAQSVLVLVLVSAFLAIGLNPTVSRLERTGLRRGAAVGVVFLGVVAFFAIVGYAVLPPVVQQVSTFVRALPQYVQELEQNRTIADLDRRFGLIAKVQNYVNNRLASDAASNILNIGSVIASTAFKGLTILILTLYFLSSFNAIKELGYRLVPRTRRARATLLGDEILSRTGGYVAGTFVVALIAGTSSLIFLSIAGAPYPLALALIITITDVIPLIGATVGAVLVTAVAFFDSTGVGIATGIFFLIYQQVENYLIYPRVMKRSVDINPAAAIIGALVGGTLLGIVGALLAIPVTAAIQLIVREVVLPRQDAG